jgi:surfeit locus 1 family protein
LSNSQTRARTFSPTWSLTLATVLLCVLFIRLGYWQWGRGNARQAQWDEFSRGADKVLSLGSRGVGDVPRYQRLSVAGRYEPDHQFLLDNRTHAGRAGYEVLTPLVRPDGRVLLVDRGWVPFTGTRSQLPDVACRCDPVATVTVTGRSDELPTAGLAAGRAPPPADGKWPQVTSYPTMSELSRAMARALEPRIVLLDPNEPNGYVRDWHPAGIQPVRHWSYAIQWWAFAVVAVIFWAVLIRRKPEAL